MSKKLSVITPTYNQKMEFLISAFYSVLNQTQLPHEYIVVRNGGSETPNCLAVLENHFNLGEHYKVEQDGDVTISTYNSLPMQVKFIEVEKNRLTGGGLNLGIEYAEGDRIGWLSSDDFFYPQFVEAHQVALDLFGKPVSYSAWSQITYDQNGKMVDLKDYGATFVSRDSRPFVVEQELFYRELKSELVRGSCQFNGCAFVLDKKVIDEVGSFNEELTLTQDFDMWLRVSEQFSVVIIPQILMCRRNHSNQTKDMYEPKEVSEMRHSEFEYMRKRFLNG